MVQLQSVVLLGETGHVCLLGVAPNSLEGVWGCGCQEGLVP